MKPLRISKKDFNAQHRSLSDRLHAFSLTKRGRRIGTKSIIKDVKFSSASSLKAINSAARIRFADRFCAKFKAFILENAIDEVFFVTLIVREHAVPLSEAAGFDLVACKEVTSRFFEDLDYIGLIEAAYYYRTPFIAGAHQPFVSWHSHAIVWSVTHRDLAARRQRFNQEHRAFVPGKRAAHFQLTATDSVSSYVRYMSKSLLKEYTAYPKMRKALDLETGEVIKQPTGRWRNRKRSIRPTNLVRAMRAMGGRTLKQLSFAGGTGKGFRRALLKASRDSLKGDAAARTARRRMLLFAS
ncbi:hypothetical protein ELH50_01295 [Rhizobium ruizarguesonis]|uniref:hypothetical protein n=1 Tax=Rhizobium TaxID=379 RepID=UPI001031413F|nr:MULTISPECIES: hypothetical protein [Rhizobium]TAU81971.1 hypothetical protein ELI40_01020 [Rhizobium leguminosarum]TBB09831.1 hypothetical protein ELH50_01295 [Rhizobium ruizarguesonis]